jgi:hypothetical protein
MVEVKSYIERLAATECPRGCKPGDYSYVDHQEAGTECSCCDGHGVLVPGLRRECGCAKYDGMCGECWEENRGRYLDRSRHNEAWVHPSGCICQGRGWALIPEGEWMGVLIRFIHKVGWEFSYDVWEGTTTIFIWNAKTGYEIGEATGTAFDEETLAQAILEAMGIL